MDSLTRSVFRPATPRTLEIIAEHNREQRCNFLLGSNFINPAAAKLSYILSDLVSGGRVEPYFSYLVSSGLEALSGAINLARHTAARAKRDNDGWVLLIDRGGRCQQFMDPLGVGSIESLIPHVVSASSIDHALREFAARSWAAVIIFQDEDIDLQDQKITDLVQACRQGGGQVDLCCTELELTSSNLFHNQIDADVMIFGESLSDRQVPFGAYTMSPEANQVWRNMVDCFAQTSTFGGNVLCASLTLDALDQHGYVTEQHREVLRAIDADPTKVIDCWGRHIKPDIAALAKISSLHVDVRKAAGGRFTTVEGWDIIDCIGGLGSNLRGHNPPDLVDEVLALHDPYHDYFTDLEKKLYKLTRLAHAFPAVSGAIANTLAVTLAALANPQRRTVVTFKGNFGGKTMFAINLSKHVIEQAEDSDVDAFRPYYSKLIYIDPFAADAVDHTINVLSDADVALVWFEYVQGTECRRLPDNLVKVIDRHRSEHGYLVGVDEILTGGWRSSKHYLAHRDMLECADIVTLGKTMSDMTLPAAAVLVSEDVYNRAEATASALVARLKSEFRNNLGAHVSLHALESVGGPQQCASHQSAYADLITSLNTMFRGSKVFAGVVGSAAQLRLAMNKRYLRSAKKADLLEIALSELVYRRCHVFMPGLRIAHRVMADPADLTELVRRLAAGTKGITPLMVRRYALGLALASTRPRMSKLLQGRAGTLQV